jgi:hypothetical protein
MSKRGIVQWMRSPLTIQALLIAILTAGSAVPAFAHMVRLTESEMVHGSKYIVVAVVKGAQSRWNEQHTLILTDYTLSVEDHLKGWAPANMTLTILGGALDGERHDTCVSTHLEQGTRYLLFLRDPDHPTFAPVTGAWQGVFRETREIGGKRRVAAGRAASSEETLEFGKFVEGMRVLVTRVEAEPQTSSVVEAGTASGLPSKVYDPAARPEKEWLTTPPLAQPAPESPPLPWNGFASSLEVEEMGDGMAEEGLSFIREKYYLISRAPAPIVFNPLPPGFPFAPFDQYQMAAWNLYAKDLFRVRSATNTWSYGNGVNDITGFPPESQMLQQFGRGWSNGLLGVTFLRFYSNGIIAEADIALNPSYPWSTDELFVASSPVVNSFQQTMLHELGHAWGLWHPFEYQDVWWDSVMNYAPKDYRLPLVFSDDTAAARATYPGITLRDGLISSYITRDTINSRHAAYVPTYPVPSVVRSGESFTLGSPIKVENTGTVRLAKPSVEVYLTPRRFDWTGAIYLKTLKSQAPVRTFPNSTVYLNIGSITVPYSVPPGTYYLGFFLRDNKDKIMGNNSAWTNSNITLTVVPIR